MSDDHSKPSPAATQTPSAPAPAAATTPTPAAAAHGPALSDLMASGDKATAKTHDKAKPDLDADALRAAQAAVEAGAKALAEARAQLQAGGPAPVSKQSRRREIALRALLVVNVVAMLVVAMLPSPNDSGTSPTTAPAAHGDPHASTGGHDAAHGDTSHAANGHDTGHGKGKHGEPYNLALQQADGGDFAAAVATLESYLAANPRMQAASKAAVLNTAAYYASRAGDAQRAESFTRQYDALKGSHSLPEDLIAEAKAAIAAKDQDKLRRTWARFLLQQKQIPPFLYKHVAEAYLQLGDSYRLEAEAGAAAQRLQDAKAAEEKLRDAAIRAQERGK